MQAAGAQSGPMSGPTANKVTTPDLIAMGNDRQALALELFAAARFEFSTSSTSSRAWRWVAESTSPSAPAT